MARDPDDRAVALDGAERERLAAVRAADDLADLAGVMGADTGHAAYVAAKPVWRDLRRRELAARRADGDDGGDGDRDESGDRGRGDAAGIPGACVRVDGHDFHVHGVTHADTAAEGEFLRERVAALREAGAAVYCEQGIRSMYFGGFPGVCAMDDYRWAMARCRELDVDSHVDGFDGVDEDVAALAGQFRDAAFSLIDAGGDVYGAAVARSLGDVASDFLRSHEDLATGDDFESFRYSRRAAEDPAHLPALQRYYETAFLPQPLEREWLRRHDPELELVTHARNERMADYAVSHNDEATAVHLVVGAAHQPGVRYYLERVRDGQREVAFEPVA